MSRTNAKTTLGKRAFHRASEARRTRPRQKSRLFLMYTENTGEAGLRNIKSALDRKFAGYTLEQNALGRYKRESEKSVVAHVLTHDKNAVRSAAAEICAVNKQQSVLCVELPVVWKEFVSGPSLKKASSDICHQAPPNRGSSLLHDAHANFDTKEDC